MFLAYWLERAVEEEPEVREVGAIADLHRRLARSVQLRARQRRLRCQNRRVNIASASTRRSLNRPYRAPGDPAIGPAQDLRVA
jgi:hypothetical protein